MLEVHSTATTLGGITYCLLVAVQKDIGAGRQGPLGKSLSERAHANVANLVFGELDDKGVSKHRAANEQRSRQYF